MPQDRVYIQLSAAIASNSTQAFAVAWDSKVAPVAGTVRGVTAVASALTSSGRLNSVQVHRQPSGTSAASNASISLLVAPISLVGNNTSVDGAIAQSGSRISAGDIIQLRTDTGTLGGQNAFGLLTATVAIEPDS